MRNLLFRLTIVLLTLSHYSCELVSNADTSRPNIIVILSDDSGYSDISYFGSEISTPHLSRLAEEGIVFPHFYNNGRCSPSRASLLTGHYPQKVGVGELAVTQNETDLPGYLGYLSFDYPLLPELLQDQGYYTSMSGKWHLGGQMTYRGEESLKWPNQRGFDYFFGILGGTLKTHFKPYRQEYMLNGKYLKPEEFKEDFFSTDEMMDRAIASLDINRDGENKPYFLYLPFSAPHLPLEAPQDIVDKYLKKYESIESKDDLRKQRFDILKKKKMLPPKSIFNKGKVLSFKGAEKGKEQNIALATHAALIENMDKNIGKLISNLKDHDELDNTIIFYLSDNGISAYGVSAYFNAPYVGRKGMLREGGIKTPLIVHWPNGQRKGSNLVDKAWHIMDIAPTCIDIVANGGTDDFTGVSFKSQIMGKNKSDNGEYLERDYLFWVEKKNRAILSKDGYKLIGQVLYNLKNDPCETKNLLEGNYGLIQEMKTAYQAHRLDNNIEPQAKVNRSRINR